LYYGESINPGFSQNMGESNPVQLAEVCQLYDVQSSFSGLDLGDKGGVRRKVPRDVDLRETSLLACFAQHR
jgi:hypothetical protein